MGSFSVTVPRVSNTLRAQLILSNLNQTAADLLRLQNQISSGKRILVPSDHPFDAAVAGQLQSFLEQKACFQQNIQNAVSVLSTADAALGQAVDLINQAQSIGLEEIGVTATPETRQSAAAIIDQIIGEMITIGNSEFAGRYIFSGRDTITAPFQAQGNTISFEGDTGSVEVSIDYSASSSTSVDAAAAFGAISTEVRGTADLDPIVTLDTLLSELNGGEGVEPGSIIIRDGVNTSTVDLSHAATVRDVINAINAGTPASTTASISMSGEGIQINCPGGNLTVTSALGVSTADDLGILRTTGTGPVLVGDDINPIVTLYTPLAAISSVDWTSGLEIINGDYQATVDFAGCNNIQAVINSINTAGVYVEAKINDTGTGIDIVSRLSGGNLRIGENGGTTAANMGVRTFDLPTRLSTLNSGAGVETVAGDDLQITLKDSTTFGVDLSSAVTVSDVLAAINSAPGNPGTLVASLASSGNGIVLTDTSGGAGDLSVARANLSNAAEDLGILATTSGTTISGEDTSGVSPDGILSHLLGLKDALLSNDDTMISFYTDKIEQDLPRVLETRASVGARQQRLETVGDRISNEVLELESMLSDRVDLDYAASIVRYSTLQASFEAGLQTAGSFLQMSLIDFLN